MVPDAYSGDILPCQEHHYPPSPGWIFGRQMVPDVVRVSRYKNQVSRMSGTPSRTEEDNIVENIDKG